MPNTNNEKWVPLWKNAFSKKEKEEINKLLNSEHYQLAIISNNIKHSLTNEVEPATDVFEYFKDDINTITNKDEPATSNIALNKQ